MTRRPDAPPILAERLLGAVIGSQQQCDAVLGDLHEEFVCRARASHPKARLWYWKNSAGIAATLLRRRLGNGLKRSSSHYAPATTHGDSVMRTLGLETRQ